MEQATERYNKRVNYMFSNQTWLVVTTCLVRLVSYMQSNYHYTRLDDGLRIYNQMTRCL